MIDPLLEDAQTVAAAIARLAGRDLSALSGHEGVNLLGVLTPALDQLNAVRLETVGVVADSGVWSLDGTRSAATWLARVQRTTRPAAGSDLKTARALRGHLPLTSAALLEGSVPVGHARILARTCLKTEPMRAMLTDPDRGEGFLLTEAGLGAEDFQKFCAAWAYRVDPDAGDACYQDTKDACYLTVSPTTGGAKLDGFLTPLAAETLTLVLPAEIGVSAVTDFRTTPQRLHDALESVMNRVLAGGQLGDHASVRPNLVVNVPYATFEALALKAGTSKADLVGLPPATLGQSGQVISRVILERMMCDSQVSRVVFGPKGLLLDLGRAARTFAGARRRALDAHDGGCMYPGCDAPPCQCEGHHTDPGGWAAGARTDARHGGILLCYHHHDHVHQRDIGISRDERGNWVFTDRYGRTLGTSRPRSLEPDLFNPAQWDTAV